MVGDVGSPGNYYIPDHTLAQLTVKELNKRVSQVSQPSLLLTVVCVVSVDSVYYRYFVQCLLFVYFLSDKSSRQLIFLVVFIAN